MLCQLQRRGPHQDRLCSRFLRNVGWCPKPGALGRALLKAQENTPKIHRWIQGNAGTPPSAFAETAGVRDFLFDAKRPQGGEMQSSWAGQVLIGKLEAVLCWKKQARSSGWR